MIDDHLEQIQALCRTYAGRGRRRIPTLRRVTGFAESTVEEAALAWIAGLGWEVLHGPEIAYGSAGAERGSAGYRDVFLERRVRDPLSRLNPELPTDAVGDAQAQVPSPFGTNVALAASDRTQARIGVVGADREWFKPWRTIQGDTIAPAWMAELQVLLEGVFEHRRFLDLVRHFVVFEDASAGRVT